MQTPWGECAVADAHVHFFSRRFFELLASQAGKSVEAIAAGLGWELPAGAVEGGKRWAAELNVHGVKRAALIASLPGDSDSVRTAAAACPGRFLAYAMINPLAEAPEAARGLDAICLFPAMHGYFIHDARVEPFFEQAAAAGMLVFVHCGVLTVGVRKKLGLPSLFDMRYSNPIDLHGVALRHSRVRFVVPHFGAGYFREALMLADLCPNVYLDTSSSNSWMRYEGLDLKTVFRRALDVAGPARLLFGTDSSFFPRGWNREIFQAQTQALHELGVSGVDARLILGENLMALREPSAP
ncbi:MAG TPA: amidohydrolase family protein [Bryobacteraceae bacterium]|nr:amidohydrolase family protein [Bryobacteraceae bacterium]